MVRRTFHGREVVVALTRGSAIIADTIVIAVTWSKMYRPVKQALGLSLPIKTSLVMLSDGALRLLLVFL